MAIFEKVSGEVEIEPVEQMEHDDQQLKVGSCCEFGGSVIDGFQC